MVEVGVGRVESSLVCALNCWHLFVPSPTPRAMLGSAKSHKLVTEQIVVCGLGVVRWTPQF